jgi:hypothetical protein
MKVIPLKGLKSLVEIVNKWKKGKKGKIGVKVMISGLKMMFLGENRRSE